MCFLAETSIDEYARHQLQLQGVPQVGLGTHGMRLLRLLRALRFANLKMVCTSYCSIQYSLWERRCRGFSSFSSRPVAAIGAVAAAAAAAALAARRVTAPLPQSNHSHSISSHSRRNIVRAD